MLDVKIDRGAGCTFLGKGIVGHPEMGVIEECREVTFDEWDNFEMEWKDLEIKKLVYKTSTGYVIDEEMLMGNHRVFEIEEFVDNNYVSSIVPTEGIRWKS